jgi:hypothetical protein
MILEECVNMWTRLSRLGIESSGKHGDEFGVLLK